MTKFVVSLWLDGYEDQEEHDRACIEALNEAFECLGGAASGQIIMKVIEEEKPVEICQNKLLYVGGSTTAFRCISCGSNVFSHMKDDSGEYYECHGCHTEYRGEKYDTVG